MTKKTSYIFIFTLLFLISIFILAGCNQENKQNIDESTIEPTIEEKIEGIWSAERRRDIVSENSYLLLSDNREIYLSTNITKIYRLSSDEYFYEGDVYKGYYSIIEQKYLVLNLTQFKLRVETESENILEIFNSTLSNFNSNSTKTLIYEIQNDGEILKSVEDNPYRYIKIGE